MQGVIRLLTVSPGNSSHGGVIKYTCILGVPPRSLPSQLACLPIINYCFLSSVGFCMACRRHSNASFISFISFRTAPQDSQVSLFTRDLFHTLDVHTLRRGGLGGRPCGGL